MRRGWGDQAWNLKIFKGTEFHWMEHSSHRKAVEKLQFYHGLAGMLGLKTRKKNMVDDQISMNPIKSYKICYLMGRYPFSSGTAIRFACHSSGACCRSGGPTPRRRGWGRSSPLPMPYPGLPFGFSSRRDLRRHRSHRRVNSWGQES